MIIHYTTFRNIFPLKSNIIVTTSSIISITKLYTLSQPKGPKLHTPLTNVLITHATESMSIILITYYLKARIVHMTRTIYTLNAMYLHLYLLSRDFYFEFTTAATQDIINKPHTCISTDEIHQLYNHAIRTLFLCTCLAQWKKLS